MKINIKNARPGMKLEENVVNVGGCSLLNAGQELTNETIEQLKNKQIEYVNVCFKKELAETLPDDLQNTMLDSLKKFNIKATVETAKKMVTKIINSKYLSFSLSKYYLEEEDIYKHSVNTSAFAIALAKNYNETVSKDEEIDLNNVAIAAILHDIGKLCEDEKLLKKLEKLNLDKRIFTGFTPEDYESYNKKMYPLYGYIMLKNLDIPQVAKNAILFQKENEVGTGYLKTISALMKNKKNQSATIANIINVADWYESLISLIVKKGISPSNVIEIMGQLKVNCEADANLVDILFKNIPIYSVGTILCLSTGQIAKVIDIENGPLDRPKVLTIDSNEIIDLYKTTTITITKVVELEIDDNLYLNNYQIQNIEIEEKEIIR